MNRMRSSRSRDVLGFPPAQENGAGKAGAAGLRAWLQASRWSCCSGSSFSDCSPTAPTADPPIPARVVDRDGESSSPGTTSSTARRSSSERADAVRLDLRPRRLPRPRLHRRLPAPLGGLVRESYGGRAAPTGRASRPSPTSRRTATTPRPTRSVHRARRRRIPGAREHYRRVLRRRRPRSPGCARTRSPTRGDPAAHRVLRLDGVDGLGARPGHNYSYTNNWPPEPLVGNQPTANVVVWSVLSLIALLGGIGLLFAAFGRWHFLGWHGREQATPPLPLAGRRRAHAGPAGVRLVLLCVMAALFLLQTLVGGAVRSTTAPTSASFFGIDLAQVAPLQPGAHLAPAARDLLGRDLVPGGRDLPGADDRRAGAARAGWLAFGLLGALVVVVFGSLVGELAASTACSGTSRPGRHPGVGVPRPRPLLAGPADRSGCSSGVILYRGLRGRLRRRARGNMPWLFFFAALAIPAFYAVGLLARRRRSLHDRRLLALLGRPPLGRGLPGAVHDGHGRLPLRAARGGVARRSRCR